MGSAVELNVLLVFGGDSPQKRGSRLLDVVALRWNKIFAFI